jgi:hypothetical protein
MEDLSSTLGIKLGYFAGWFFLREPASQNAASGCASDQVKESARGLPGALLDPLKEPGGNDPPDTATIDAQNADDLVCHSLVTPCIARYLVTHNRATREEV